jgi:hypothetical protein
MSIYILSLCEKKLKKTALIKRTALAKLIDKEIIIMKKQDYYILFFTNVK